MPVSLQTKTNPIINVSSTNTKYSGQGQLNAGMVTPASVQKKLSSDFSDNTFQRMQQFSVVKTPVTTSRREQTPNICMSHYLLLICKFDLFYASHNQFMPILACFEIFSGTTK
mmetsp:Transcript_5160/g.10436  ORF Transcript_5160/g.10436 Transcript_5160/m.10436 type:complete len:113 (+) Transcript_5160:1248-1586(+)